MSTPLFTKASDARPFDLAKECLSPRLREDGGLDKASLPSSKYFKQTVGISIEGRFAEPLSKLVSPDVMSRMERAALWVTDLVRRVTGRELSFVEPLVVPLGVHNGNQLYPFINLNERNVRAIDAALSAQDWREKEKKQKDDASKADQPASSLEKPVPQFEITETKETLECSVRSRLVHELVHGARGVQIGRESTDIVRNGLAVNAFGASPAHKRFSSFTEGAAVLTQGRYLRGQGLIDGRGRVVNTVLEASAPELKALGKDNPAASSESSVQTKRKQLFSLLKETGMKVSLEPNGDATASLQATIFESPDAHVALGYGRLHWGMEHLATEIFRGRVASAPEAVERFQETLLKAEVLAEPRPLFKEIMDLAKKDLSAVSGSTPDRERELGKAYLEFFSKLRPSHHFDMVILQGFVRADMTLPPEKVAQCRSELIDLFKHATKDLDMRPNTNAG